MRDAKGFDVMASAIHSRNPKATAMRGRCSPDAQRSQVHFGQQVDVRELQFDHRGQRLVVGAC